MSNELIPMDALQQMAQAFAKSGMFGAKTPDQCMALLLLASGEGIHPAIAMRDFDLIQGRPAKKAEAMHRSFLAAGGTVEWHALDDAQADATFSHPQGGSARIKWDMARVKQAKISNEAMYTKYPRQMLRSRCISEGCRTVYPAATSGLYEPGEVAGFAKEKDMGPVQVVDADDEALKAIEHDKPSVLADVLKAIKDAKTPAKLKATATLASKLPDDMQKDLARTAYSERAKELAAEEREELAGQP